MTISIEYEAEKKLDLPYEEIIHDMVLAALDYEECPYEAEVNVIRTDNESIWQSTVNTGRLIPPRTYCHSPWWIM